MIHRVHIKNFKSLRDVVFEMGHTTCLVGLNDSGKSTILQALGFLGAIMSGKVDEWLKARGWSADEIQSNLPKWGQVKFVIFEVDAVVSNGYVRWSGEFNTEEEYLCCTSEEMIFSSSKDFTDSRVLMSLKGGDLRIESKGVRSIETVYQGSVVANYLKQHLPDECVEFRDLILGLRSMDLLSPRDMRLRSRVDNSGEIGDRGELIAAYLATLDPQDINQRLVPELKKFFPFVIDINTRKTRGGWTEFFVCQKFDDQVVETVALHCNDGLLRVLAILAQLVGNKKILCFDEIENGLSIDIQGDLIDTLKKSGRQFLITTHSILILNFLEPKDIVLVYKNEHGETKTVKINEIKTFQENSKYFAAGDALSISSLKDLVKEVQMTNA